jgi:hypothetical protein
MRRHAEAAHALDRELTEAAFQLAKARMALDAPETALQALRKAIDAEFAFAVRAAEDPDHRRHGEVLNGFFDALRREKAREIAERARAALEPLEPFAAKSRDFAAFDAVARLRAAASDAVAAWGLVDLLAYGTSALSRDAESARREFLRRKGALRVERHVTTSRWREEIQVDEPYEVEETWYEYVVVKPGGWFRKPVVESVARTRRVQRVRKVARTVERTTDEARQRLLDGFGEVV